MTNQFIDNHIQPLDLPQENANLRELLNKSMTENAELLQQVTDRQEAWRMAIDSWQKCVSENEALVFKLAEADKRINELDATLDKVQNSWLDANLRIDELTTALHQLIAQINASTTVIDKRFNQDGIVHVDYVTALTDLLNGRNEAQKVLGNATTFDDVAEVAFSATAGTKVEGCHSAGVHSCYGDLWTCVACKRTFCQAEGSTDMIELCNECWIKARAEEAK